jgi:hypothetical protein
MYEYKCVNIRQQRVQQLLSNLSFFEAAVNLRVTRMSDSIYLLQLVGSLPKSLTDGKKKEDFTHDKRIVLN